MTVLRTLCRGCTASWHVYWSEGSTKPRVVVAPPANTCIGVTFSAPRVMVVPPAHTCVGVGDSRHHMSWLYPQLTCIGVAVPLHHVSWLYRQLRLYATMASRTALWRHFACLYPLSLWFRLVWYRKCCVIPLENSTHSAFVISPNGALSSGWDLSAYASLVLSHVYHLPSFLLILSISFIFLYPFVSHPIPSSLSLTLTWFKYRPVSPNTC